MRMDELQVGDYVMSGEGTFSLVYGFGHLDRDREESFHQIYYTRLNNDQVIDASLMSIIEISSKHLIFVNKNNRLLSIPACDVIVGDVLSNNHTVMQINTVVRQGLFAPLTMTGDIVVSGILASNYVDILNGVYVYDLHQLAHAVFLPQRLFCNYFLESCKNETYHEGYGYFAYFLVRCCSVFNYHKIYILYDFKFMVQLMILMIALNATCGSKKRKQLKTK